MLVQREKILDDFLLFSDLFIIKTFQAPNVAKVLVNSELRPHYIILVYYAYLTTSKLLCDCFMITEIASQKLDPAPRTVHAHGYHIEN